MWTTDSRSTVSCSAVLLAIILLLNLTMIGGAQERVISLDSDSWLIAADPENIGQQEQWQKEPVPNARPATVPKISQFALPGYHGVMWYWRKVSLPVRPEQHSRYLLRFGAVFYKADIYVNGQSVGSHEGGETPFTLDITNWTRPGQENLLAVRVLDPLPDRAIDGMRLSQVPHRVYGGKYIPTPAGIIDSVELSVRPALYVSDLYVRPDWKTGRVGIDAEVVNTLDRPVPGRLDVGIALDGTSTRLSQIVTTNELATGQSLIPLNLSVPDWRLWDLDHPTLYRVTLRLTSEVIGRESDVCSIRCGFRDFRLADGYFRLNGKRIYVRSALTANHDPVGIYVPYDQGTRPDVIQRGMLEAKQLGFNMVRFIGSIPRKNVVDYCDEIGLLLYVESMASFGEFHGAPKTVETKERFDRSIREMILRDRNHPSVAIWGLLNETPYSHSGFEFAWKSLPLVRQWDPTRLVLLSSGRWDKHLGVGSGSNPGSVDWDVYLGDEHPGGKVGGEAVGDVHTYPTVPHSPASIAQLRRLGQGWRSGVFLSEYGVGSGQHLPEILALHEQHGGQQMEMYHWFADMHQRFLVDWRAWRLDTLFGSPRDFFDASLAAMASRRWLGINAVRSNPHLVGYSVTSLVDIPTSGEGVLDSQRRPKAGMSRVMRDVWAPLRLCLFAEPYNLYRGQSVQLEAVLANEDVRWPGQHQVELRVTDLAGTAVWHKTVAVDVPGKECPLAIPFFSEALRADWPAGEYHLTAKLVGGADAADGAAVFHIGDQADMPAVNGPVTFWGRDEELCQWLKAARIPTVPYSTETPKRRELILVGRDRPADFQGNDFLELPRRVARGSTVVFLSHLAWTRAKTPKKGGGRALLWPPLMQQAKTSVQTLPMWLYLADHWAQRHPVFSGMPAGGMLDHVYYREIIGSWCLAEAPPPAEAIAGAIDTSFVPGGYHSGLTLAAYELGAGRFFINTLEICGNLGKAPAAEHLLRNLLNYAGRDLDKPLCDLPSSIDQMLQERVAAFPLSARKALPVAGPLLLEEKFDSPSATGWATAGGAWRVGPGQYRQTGTEGRSLAYFVGGSRWTDYIVSAQVPAGVGQDRNTGLSFRVGNEGRDAYVLRFWDSSSLMLGLIRDEQWREVEAYPFTSTPGRTYTLKLVAQGSNFDFFVDGAWIGAAQDETLQQGTIGLYTYGQTAAFGPVRAAELVRDEK